MAKGFGGFGIEIEGMGELIKAMELFPEKLYKRSFKRALKFAITPVTKAAKRKAPKKSGRLKKALTYKVRAGKAGNVPYGSAAVGAVNKDDMSGRHAHLLELGFNHKSGKRVSAQPFLRPAIDEKGEEAINRLNDKMAEILHKEANSLGWL